MRGLPDFNSLLLSSSKRFNAERALERRKGKQRTNIILSLDNPVIRDLSAHDLSGVSFYFCTFKNCTFGGFKNTNFNNCVFENCTFSFSPKSSMSVQKILNTVFFECTFKGANFAYSYLKDVSFVEPVIEEVPSFKQCTLDGLIIYDAEAPSRLLVDQFANARTTDDLQIFFKGGEISAEILNWERIRMFSKLPFLQISLIGTTTLSLLAIFLQYVNSPFESIAKSCNNIANSETVFSQSFRQICNTFENLTIATGMLLQIQTLFFAFIVIFIGALIQTINCPEEVSEFSRAQWERHLRRPPEIYTVLSIRSKIAIYAASILQGIGIAIFIYKTGNALLAPFP